VRADRIEPLVREDELFLGCTPRTQGRYGPGRTDAVVDAQRLPKESVRSVSPF
jgi:hypothetical protein